MTDVIIFPGLYLDPEYSTEVQVTDTAWIIKYGSSKATITREDADTYTFTFDETGDIYVTYNASNGSTQTSGNNITVGVSTTGHYTILDILLKPSAGIQKRWLVTFDNNYPGSFVMNVQPILSLLSSTLVTQGPSNVPTIQVTFLPMFDFWDSASVTFTLENVQENIGCASGSYNQLIGKKKDGIQDIHVSFPLVTCYLAGKGHFSVDKIFSVNGKVELFWPQVFLYAQAKFILWRLMKDTFDMSIVLRKNTKEFLYNLKKSKYSNFLDYFSQNSSMEKYFLFTLK